MVQFGVLFCFVMLDSTSLPSQQNRKTKLGCYVVQTMYPSSTHADREILLDDQKRIGEAAGLSEDVMVRVLVEFEDSVQIESH